MGLQKFIYAFLLAIFILFPVILSYKMRDGYLKKLKYFFPAMLFAAIIFSIWDVRFTELGIWTFHPEFVSGISFRNLPVEEWLFFFAVPFFSVYFYEWLKGRGLNHKNPNLFVFISLVLLVVFGLITYFFRKELYTFFTFFLLTIYFGYTIFRNNFKKNYPNFYLSFIIALVPFLIFRGILTALPVISFDSFHIMNIHIFTVPVEDIGYFFLLHLMNVTIYEYLSEKQFF
jgi:lycopene cyclase domain-containing protein